MVKLNLADMPYKFISEENLIKFLKEKMNYTYSADELRSAFTYKESETKKDTFEQEFKDKYLDKLDTYEITFKYEDDHYVFESIKKV